MFTYLMHLVVAFFAQPVPSTILALAVLGLGIWLAAKAFHCLLNDQTPGGRSRP